MGCHSLFRAYLFFPDPFGIFLRIKPHLHQMYSVKFKQKSKFHSNGPHKQDESDGFHLICCRNGSHSNEDQCWLYSVIKTKLVNRNGFKSRLKFACTFHLEPSNPSMMIHPNAENAEVLLLTTVSQSSALRGRHKKTMCFVSIELHLSTATIKTTTTTGGSARTESLL